MYLFAISIKSNYFCTNPKIKPMKRIITFVLSVFAIGAMAQPIIDGKYLPARETSVNMVYDAVSVFTAPTIGINQNWDYTSASGNFLIGDTEGPFYFKTKQFDSIPTWTNFQLLAPTLAGKSTAPVYLSFLDSADVFFKVNLKGLQSVGFYSHKKSLAGLTITPTAYVASDLSLDLPLTIGYNVPVLVDTFIATGYPNIYIGGNPIPSKIIHTTIKTMSTPAYGTLKTPAGTFPDVLLAKESSVDIDSIYIGGNLVQPVSIDTFINYSFLRNNTFGTSLLLGIHHSNQNTDWGRYTLPTDFGSISGTVTDSGQAGLPVTSGVAVLYREKSNFTREDVLKVTPIGANGYYQFDSIPYGNYRVAAKANKVLYPNSFTTYHGDSLEWHNATTVNTVNIPVKSGIDIKLAYKPVTIGTGHAKGAVYFDWVFHGKVNAAQPIPGIDISAKKNPGGVKSQISTDGNGQFDLSGLDDGQYVIFVDMAGMEHHQGEDTINIVGGNTVQNIIYTCGKDSLYKGANLVTVNNYTADNSSARVYPNPFDESTTIDVTLKEKGNVSLSIYNILGEKVSTIENGTIKAAGNYKYEFSSQVPSGVYFVKLNVNGKLNTFKIVKQ